MISKTESLNAANRNVKNSSLFTDYKCNTTTLSRVPIYAQLCVFDAQKSQRMLAFSCQCAPGTHGSLFLL